VSELRQDPVTGLWVAVATERAKRPHEFISAAKWGVETSGACPFCPGNESETPPEVMAYRMPGTAPDTPGWQVRVVPNLYPAFGPATGESAMRTEGPYRAMHALGVHEVLIITPEHRADIGALPLEDVKTLVRCYVDRYLAHRNDPTIEYITIVHNHGREAGASREHPHSQLFGIPLVPSAVETELAGLRRWREERAGCAYCDLVQYECKTGDRLVYENEQFVVFAPYASRVPFETWSIPKAHWGDFEAMNEGQQAQFADALRALLAKVVRGLNGVSFNYWIHSAPCRTAGGDLYHWHLELLPKLSIQAGFELGAGVMIETVPPEQAAAFLRGVDVEGAFGR
jgi:UDPglucose--hexose-1-phosphate uridylyltransferase